MNEQLRHKVDRSLTAMFEGFPEDVSLDHNGMVTLRFDDEGLITVEVPEAGTQVLLYAPILALPAQDEAVVMSRALAANLFKIRVPGAWIALDQERQTLLLCLSLEPDDCGEARLNAAFTDMLAEVVDLGRTIAGSYEPRAAEPEAETSLTMFRI